MSGILLSPIFLQAPAPWQEREPTPQLRVIGARVFQREGLRVIGSLEVHDDGLRWAHVSCSRGMRLPSWEDLKEVKEIFLGDIPAYQVLPPKAEYVNVHPFTLHLWHCVDADPFPKIGRLPDPELAALKLAKRER